MTKFFVCITFICLAIFLTSLLLWAIWRWCWKAEPEPAPQPRATEEVSLEDLSLIWTIPIEDQIMSIADLNKYKKKEPAGNASEQNQPGPEFRHQEIARFYLERVEAGRHFHDDSRECAEDILKLLDLEGDCPSVVNRNPREAEKGLEADVYAALSGLPLYLHSLNVAERIASLCSRKEILPKGVIAGLAHDLGKIPSFQERLFSTGDHSSIAPIVLGTLERFKKLSFGYEIIEAIRLHHRPNPEPDLAVMLKDADQAARKQEIADMMVPGNQPEGDSGEPSSRGT